MKRLLGLAALCIGGTAAFAANFPETEPNDTKAAANAVTMTAGDTVSGSSTGNSTTSPGAASADYFRVKTGSLTLNNIYRHRLTLTGDTTNMATTIRGLTQSAGAIQAGTDATLESSSPTTVPARFVQWYGFGRQEEIYFRVTGTVSAANAGAYSCALSTTNVTASVIDVGAVLDGPITITGGTGNTSILDFWLYDSNLNPIVDAGVTGTTAANSTLTRNLSAGVYYVAFSNSNTANNLASPADSPDRSGSVLDFANGVLNSTSTTIANMNIKVTDAAGAHEATGAKSGAYDIVWYKFTVTSANIACCFANGSCSNISASTCASQGGAAQGVGSTCSPNPCPQPGACCLINGGCAQLLASACTAAVGTFNGENVPCPSSCPEAQACCLPNGSCLDRTTDQCTTSGGTSLGSGSTCGDATCVKGACCHGLECTRDYQQTCESGGGVYHGDGTSCGAVAGVPITYTSNPNLSIPDAGAAVTDTINIPASYTIGDVNVHVVIPNHTFVGDLNISLLHDSTTVQLWSRDCGGNNGMDVVFDDEGVALVCGQPTTGTFTTDSITAGQFLDAFDGGNVNGDWTITIQDLAGADTGTLTTWELIIDRPGVGVCFPNEQNACCFLNGSCQFLFPADCVNAGGSVLGLNTNCSPNNCPQPQRCCLRDGTCQFVPPDNCLSLGGVSGGVGTDCNGSPCPPAVACCLNNGAACQDLTAAACASSNGQAGPVGSNCAGNWCVRGACCHDVTCTSELRAPCVASGGFFQGEGTTCDSVAGTPTTYNSDPNIPIPDAGAAVTDTINIADSYTIGDVNVHVVIPDHTYLSDLTIQVEHLGTIVALWSRDCVTNDFMDVTFDDEGTALVCGNPTTGTFTPDSITAGSFLNVYNGMNVNGDWTLTVQDNVGIDVGTLTHWDLVIDVQGIGICFPNEPIACCFPNGSCQFILPTDCQANGGTVLGLGTNCSPNACPQPQRCCLPNGTCQFILVSTCTSQGGTAGGAGTNCNGNPCPPAVACCIGTGGSCQDLTVAACNTAGGAAGPAGSTCADNPSWCSRGACCNGTNCSIQTRGACVASSGTYVGANTNCGAVAGTPTTYTSNPNLSIPDPVGGVPQAVGDTIAVGDTYNIGDVKVGLIINHTFQGDIIATLTSPANTTITIINRPGQPEASTFGWGNDNYGDPTQNLYFVLSDDAAARYDVPVTPVNNPVGDWLPDFDALSAFDGQSVNGNWTLTLTDNAAGDTGFLVSWELIIDRPGLGPCAAVDERACCFANGSCQVLSQSACTSGGGVWGASGSTCTPSPCCVLGDANCDGVVNNFDIDSFVLIIVNNSDTNPPAGWQNGPACWARRGCTADIDHSGAVNNFDIDPFVACIIAQQNPCP